MPRIYSMLDSAIKEKCFKSTQSDYLILKKWTTAAGISLYWCSRCLSLCLPTCPTVIEVMSSIRIGQIDLVPGAA